MCQTLDKTRFTWCVSNQLSTRSSYIYNYSTLTMLRLQIDSVITMVIIAPWDMLIRMVHLLHIAHKCYELRSLMPSLCSRDRVLQSLRKTRSQIQSTLITQLRF